MKRTLAATALLLMFSVPSYPQKPENPRPKPPVAKKLHFDTGWWARAHWASAAYDEASTGFSTRACGNSPSCGERNPLARPIIRDGHNNARLALGFVLESAAVSSIPNKKVRRTVQVFAIAAHIYLGTKNIKTWK
jgi:hypothetical protein